MTMTLLDHVRALVEAERGLTEAIEQTLPLLSSNSNHLEASYNNFNSSSVIPPTSSSKRGAEPPLLPAPRCSAEVPTILAVARSYSLRTSAPPAWNTNLPVVGFATPNPLPHQLRGGALGAMQLSLAREEKKRKRNDLLIESQKKEREERMKILEEGEKAKKSSVGNVEQKMEGVDNEKEDMDNVVVDTDTGNSLPCANDGMIIGGNNIDPKRQEMIERQRVQIVQQQQLTSRGQPPEELLKKKLGVSMNLSESSSSSSSDEEGSDNEERL